MNPKGSDRIICVPLAFNIRICIDTTAYNHSPYTHYTHGNGTTKTKDKV